MIIALGIHPTGKFYVIKINDYFDQKLQKVFGKHLLKKTFVRIDHKNILINKNTNSLIMSTKAF